MEIEEFTEQFGNAWQQRENPYKASVTNANSMVRLGDVLVLIELKVKYKHSLTLEVNIEPVETHEDNEVNKQLKTLHQEFKNKEGKKENVETYNVRRIDGKPSWSNAFKFVMLIQPRQEATFATEAIRITREIQQMLGVEVTSFDIELTEERTFSARYPRETPKTSD